MVPNRTAITLLFFALLLASCNYPVQPTPPDTTQIAAVVIQTLRAEAATEEASVREQKFSHSVYFLSTRSGNVQVWRLDSDGVSLNQITQEDGLIDSYDVSRADGSVAFISTNRLFLVSAGGNNKQLLLDGSEANPDEADYFYTDRISDPKFSPDGRTLAYGENGIWILDMNSGEAEHILENRVDDEGPELYSPVEWAPDGSKLLVSIGLRESNLLGVLDLASEPNLIRFESDGLICCHPVWTPDNQSILIASPYLGLIDAGLWRYDASTGEGTQLIGDSALYEFVGWPLALPNGDLQFFYSSSPDVPQAELPLYMMHSGADGVSGRSQVREDALNISEALWAQDGSLALVVQSVPESGGAGPLVLVPGDGRQLQVLVDSVYQLRWGN